MYIQNAQIGLPVFALPAHADPFFTDLSGLTLQSGVGVGPGGRLVKDEYSVGGGGNVAAAAGAGVGSGMDVDGEMNQTIQHHPPPAGQPAAPANSQQSQQPFMTNLAQPATGELIAIMWLLRNSRLVDIVCAEASSCR